MKIMEGLGKSLTIPDSVLNKIDAADEKIKKLSQTVQSESKVISAAFAQMGLGLSPEKTQGLKDLSAAFKASSADALDLSSKLSSLGKTSEIDLINQKIKSLKELLAESSAAANKAQSDLNKINAGGGYVSANTLKEGKAGASLEQQARVEIAILEQQKQSIINNQNAWREYKDELDKTSLSAIRQKEEMDRLNSTFRNGTSELQKLARAQDDANKSADKRHAETIKKEEQEKAKAIKQAEEALKSENRAKLDALNIEKAYNSALNASEKTIAQRANKIDRLNIVQERMNQSGRNYSTQLAKISAETNRLSSVTETAAKKTESMRNSQRSLMDVSGQLQRKLALIFSVSQISGYVNKLIEVRGQFELQQRSLQAILQNKEQADKLFGQIEELAINSPFRLKELITYTKQLAAYRIEASKLYDTTKMLADVSAGLGVDMQRLILAYGQVKAANYLRGTELRQFSEAGINILGELSKYFSELEGRAVSVSEVFEMVSKRKVSFGDVDTVFKTLTSAGGIFYNMQEIQAETLRGQISNLKDSMDIMFNDIGKANDGVLKDFVGFARTLVENWRLLSDIMKGVAAGMAVYAIATVRAAAAQGAFAASSAASVVAQRGLAGAIVGSTKSIKALFAVLAGNPWILIATAVVGVGSYLMDLNDTAEESRKQFDILTNSNMKQAESLSSLSSEIQANNKEISEANGLLNDGAKGSNDHAKASDRLNSATQKQTVLLQRLKTDFPEVYAGLVKQKDGTIDLTEAQRAYNEQLERTNTLNYLMKEDVGLFGRDFAKQASESDKANKNRAKAVDGLKTAYNGLKAKIVDVLKTDEKINKEYGDNIRQIFNSTETYYQKLSKLRLLMINPVVTKGGFAWDVRRETESSLRDYNDAIKVSSKEVSKLNDKYELLRANTLKSIEMTAEEFAKADAKQKQSFVDNLKNFVNSAKGTQSEYVKAFIAKRIEQDFKIKVDFNPKEAEKEFGVIRENINKEVESINKELKSKSALKPIGVEEGTDDYFGNIISSVKALREEADRATKATNPLYEDMTNASKAAQLTKQADAMQKFANSYGFYDKKTGETGESTAERKFKAQLDLIKKINSEYNTLLKTTSEVDAKKNIYASFGKAYKDLGLGDIESLSLGYAGTVTKLESMLTSVPSKLKSKLQKEIADIRIQIDIEASKKSTDDLKRQIADVFDKYELGKDLEKLGLDQSTIKGFFGIDVIDIDSLKKNLSKLNDEYGKSGSDKEEILKDAQDKINDYERKSTIENLKSYTSLLKKSMSERVNIELEGLRKIEEINRLQQQGVIDATKAETLKSGVKEETSTKLDKANWNEFKNSGLYIKMFEDLDYVSSKTLEMMIAKLQTLRTSLKDLPPEDLKEIISQLSKSESELQSRNVFTSLKSSIKGYIDYLKNGKKTQKAFFDSQEKESNIKSQIDSRQVLISQLEKEYATEVNKNGETSEGALLLKDQLDASKALLNNYINQLVAQGKISKELANQLTNQQNSKKDLAGSLQQYSQYMNQAKEMVNTIASTAEYLFGTMDQGTKDTLDTINEIADGSAQAAEGMSKILKGDVIGGTMDVVTGYFKMVNAIFAIGDKKKERQIQREVKKVEELQKAYEKLEKAIDNAYSIDTLTQSTKLAEENIEAQITSYENMIAKEEAKKKTDKGRIKEWKEDIEDLKEQLKELEQKKIIALGGIGEANYKSAAEDFASAWLDAFNETGDGMTGLNDKWDDVINNMLKKQVALRVFDKYLAPVMESFDKMFEKSSANGEEVTKEELDNIKKKFEDASKLANDYATSLMNNLGVAATTSSSQLSSLTQSLQSASESTMEATNAYLNSIRFFVSEQLETLKRIELIFSSTDLTKNVLLAELKQQTQLLSSINRTFNSIVKAGHPNGGSYAQVKM